MMDIARYAVSFEPEPLLAPFGFKAGYLNELWQTVVCLRSADETEGLGVGVQSVLWSDGSIFAKHSASVGNCMMHLITERATQLAISQPAGDPISCIEEILPQVMDYARLVTGKDNLRTTFALNAMVPLDFALWMLYAKQQGMTNFHQLIPHDARPAMAARHAQLGMIPLVTYDTSLPKIRKLAQDGCFVIKIKIGADPDRDGDQDKMLAWDIARIKQIHEVLEDFTTPYTDNGRIAYYLDANGRYDSAQRIHRLLDALDTAGILDRLLLLEEPFQEGSEIDVSDLGVCVAADESAHVVSDAQQLIDLGYRAIALKPIAKTLSMSFLMAQEAHRRGVHCFCADLTVGPVMLGWNLAFAACLPPIPGVRTGLVESNGAQNYTNWDTMMEYAGQMPWLSPQKGLFHLGEDFSGGDIFTIPPHYRQLVRF